MIQVYNINTAQLWEPGSCTTNQVRVWIVPHLQLLLTTLWDQEGYGAPDVDPAAMP